MKKITAVVLILVSPCLAWALGSWTFYTGHWYNSTTGQTLNLPAGSYPAGVLTWTPTPTATNTATSTPTATITNTPTSTATATPTSTVFIYNANSGVSFNGPYAKGFGPTYTPAPAQATQAIPNVVLIGKSLGTGTGITPTPAISGGFLTIYHPSHGYSAGDYVALAGITASPTPQYGLDALVPVATVVSSDLYNVAVAGSGNVAGSALEMFWFNGSRSLNVNKIQNIIHANVGGYAVTFLSTQPNAYYGIQGWANAANHSLVVDIGAGYGLSYVPKTTDFSLICLDQTTAVDATAYLMILLSQIQ